MLALNRFVVDAEYAAEFTEQAQQVLVVLADRPGYQGGELARAIDDPAHWCLVTRWASVGAYRRALSDLQVRMRAIPLLGRSVDAPTGYEVLALAEPGGALQVGSSDLAESGGDD